MTDQQEELSEIAKCGSVSVWLDGVQHGASDAQQAIWNRYLRQLVNYANHRLRQVGVRALDGDDISQQVFDGFFRRANDGQFPQLIDRCDLWRILVRITNDRVIDARRKKYPLTESAFGSNSAESDSTPPIARLASNAPTPELGYEMADNLCELNRRMDRKHPDLKQIAALHLQGYAVQEIADLMNSQKRSVERRMEWIREIWHEFREME